jgi:hypothetical protein
LKTNWKQFQNIDSELISPRLEINTGIEADKAARDFTASIALAYRLSTTKVTLSDGNIYLPIKTKTEAKKIVTKSGIQNLKQQLIGSENQSDD